MTEESVRALGYVRVSAVEPPGATAGRAAQRAALAREAERRGWHLDVVGDVGPAGPVSLRPGLAAALHRLDERQADVLVVARLDRLSRSLAEVGALAERARRGEWSFVCLDVALDTTTAAGAFVADLLTSTAHDDRGLIGQRTREALAARRAAGVRLGRPADVPPEIVARVVAERRAGRSLLAIARGLDADGVPTARGGARWYPTTVAKLLQSQQARDL
jgi:DNA invertase Pin-like site-specific DNA recombinase